MKQVKFDKEIANIPYMKIKPDKWYDVIAEHPLTFIVKNDAGVVDGFPRTWAKEIRETVN